MSEGLEFANAPVLTLEPFPEKEEVAAVKEEQTQEPAWDDSILTEEERQRVLDEVERQQTEFGTEK